MGVLADAATTVAWQEPIGALEEGRAQHKLDGQYASLARRFDDPTPPRSRGTTTRRVSARADTHVAARLNRATSEGKVLGRLVIPRLKLKKVWVQGTSRDSLIKGPGHYPSTVLPGHRGTVGLAGHRTTHGAPFRHIDRLRRGDRITLTMPYGTFTYAVARTQIVSPQAVRVLRSAQSDRLVLTACHPLWSARQRIVVTANLVRWPGDKRA